MAPYESQDFLENGFLEDGNNIARSAWRIFSRRVAGVETDQSQVPGDVSLHADAIPLRTLRWLHDPGLPSLYQECPWETEAEGDPATEEEKGMCQGSREALKMLPAVDGGRATS